MHFFREHLLDNVNLQLLLKTGQRRTEDEDRESISWNQEEYRRADSDAAASEGSENNPGKV